MGYEDVAGITANGGFRNRLKAALYRKAMEVATEGGTGPAGKLAQQVLLDLEHVEHRLVMGVAAHEAIAGPGVRVDKAGDGTATAEVLATDEQMDEAVAEVWEVFASAAYPDAAPVVPADPFMAELAKRLTPPRGR